MILCFEGIAVSYHFLFGLSGLLVLYLTHQSETFANLVPRASFEIVF